jgi:hypothetical protein
MSVRYRRTDDDEWERQKERPAPAARGRLGGLRERVSRSLGLGNTRRRAVHEQAVSDRQRYLAGREEARLRDLREAPRTGGDAMRSGPAPRTAADRERLQGRLGRN